MLNYFLKKLKKFALFVLILLTLMILSLIGVFYSSFKFSKKYTDPNKVYEFLEENKYKDIYFTKENETFLGEKDIWAIRIDKNGNVIENFNKPKEVKNKFDISDVVRFTRYYLNDYPVFTFVVKDGILVLAYPKNSLDKLPFNYYNYDLAKINFFIFIISILFFVLLVYIFYLHEVKSIFKKLNPLQEAINNVFNDDYKKLQEEGELKEISETINEANRNYIKLKKSQSSWLRGISHDIRTPLTKLSWELEDLKTRENSVEIEKMEDQIIKISKIIEDLNLTNSLENLSDEHFEYRDPIFVIRKLIVNSLNENPSKDLIFENRINKEVKIKMEEHLFYRMLENILNNSIKYGKGKTYIIYDLIDKKLLISIKDEEGTIENRVINRLYEENLSEIQTHGMGLFVSKQICKLHKGKMEVKNLSPGVMVSFSFDIK